jgi:hypothetical protein
MLRDEARGWLRLGEVGPQLLSEMRLQTLWAAQLVAAAGAAYAPPALDGSHAAMEWIAGPELLAAGRPLRGKPFRASLRVATFSLVVLDAIERPMHELPLDGRTLSDARGWLEGVIAEYAAPDTVPLEVPVAPIAHHPVAGGRTFTLQSADACFELARWYAGADVILRELVAITPGATPVRCWPARLDLCTRLTVRADDSGQATHTNAVGMSPGDTELPEPYWYVAPSPAPAADVLPALGHGAEWMRNGTVSAVLRARKLLPGSASGQRERLVAYLEEAIAAAREALNSAP